MFEKSEVNESVSHMIGRALAPRKKQGGILMDAREIVSKKNEVYVIYAMPVRACTNRRRNDLRGTHYLVNAFRLVRELCSSTQSRDV